MEINPFGTGVILLKVFYIGRGCFRYCGYIGFGVAVQQVSLVVIKGNGLNRGLDQDKVIEKGQDAAGIEELLVRMMDLSVSALELSSPTDREVQLIRRMMMTAYMTVSLVLME